MVVYLLIFFAVALAVVGVLLLILYPFIKTIVRWWGGYINRSAERAKRTGESEAPNVYIVLDRLHRFFFGIGF
eukprot:CFRG7095T1